MSFVGSNAPGSPSTLVGWLRARMRYTLPSLPFPARPHEEMGRRPDAATVARFQFSEPTWSRRWASSKLSAERVNTAAHRP